MRALYDLDDETTANFGLECLLARRFAERGVRFIQVSHAHGLPLNNEQWDQYTHLNRGHAINVAQIDKPITGLNPQRSGVPRATRRFPVPAFQPIAFRAAED